MGLTNDSSDPGLRKIRADGQQEVYLVLSDEERAKGFEMPVYRGYKHSKCRTVTSMGQVLCETYAANPKFYGGTFCCWCRKHFPLIDENGQRAFEWIGSGEQSTDVYVGENQEDVKQRRAEEAANDRSEN